MCTVARSNFDIFPELDLLPHKPPQGGTSSDVDLGEFHPSSYRDAELFLHLSGEAGQLAQWRGCVRAGPTPHLEQHGRAGPRRVGVGGLVPPLTL